MAVGANRPDVHATISERTRVALADLTVRTRHRAGLERAFADPALRQKISERTKAGIPPKLERQFTDLMEVWEKAPKSVRERFLDSVLAAKGQGVIQCLDLSRVLLR